MKKSTCKQVSLQQKEHIRKITSVCTWRSSTSFIRYSSTITKKYKKRNQKIMENEKTNAIIFSNLS